MQHHPTFNSWTDLYDMSYTSAGFTDLDEVELMREFFYMSDPKYVNGIVEYLDIVKYEKTDKDIVNGVYSLLVTYQVNLEARTNTNTYIIRGDSYEELLLDLFNQSQEAYRIYLKHGVF